MLGLSKGVDKSLNLCYNNQFEMEYFLLMILTSSGAATWEEDYMDG